MFFATNKQTNRISFCFPSACKPFLILFFSLFVTVSTWLEMLVNAFSETRDRVTAEETMEFHRWQFILNTLKGAIVVQTQLATKHRTAVLSLQTERIQQKA